VFRAGSLQVLVHGVQNFLFAENPSSAHTGAFQTRFLPGLFGSHVAEPKRVGPALSGARVMNATSIIGKKNAVGVFLLGQADLSIDPVGVVPEECVSVDLEVGREPINIMIR